jgi:hypothetical protein
VEAVVHTYGGRSRIAVEKQPINLEIAVFLEQRLTEALEGLRRDIAAVVGANDPEPY